MKILLYLFILVSAVLFLYSVFHLTQQFSSHSLPFVGEIKGFEDVNPNDAFNQLLVKYRQKIQTYNAQAGHDQTIYFWLSFLVTALTAGSTLVSSIQAAKTKSADTKNSAGFAIFIAILAFCSTLANFASTHFNDRKTEETKAATDLTTKRNQFYTDYSKASEADRPMVIKNYELD